MNGPLITYGTAKIENSMVPGFPVADPNPDYGPNIFTQGYALFDPRYFYQKDQVGGSAGRVPAHLAGPDFKSISAIPSALAANNICNAQGVTTGVAMTLAAATTGISVNIPIIQPATIPAASTNASPPVNAMVLDFGFEFGNCTSGNAVITVANAADFSVGMPLVIAGVGNSLGTAPLLTIVTAINTVTPSITVASAPLATNATAPIGTGNIWSPSEALYSLANSIPTAHQPWLAGGPGLFLDPRQAIARGVQISGVAGGAGGAFTVRGADIYGQNVTQTITVAAGSNTVWGTKAVKYIFSVTPNFTDAGHNYTVGTSDMFGMHFFSNIWEDSNVFWAGLGMAATTGWTAGVTGTATALTGDVRGTIQVSSNGPLGSGIGASASNGTIASLAMTGRRLFISQQFAVHLVLATAPANPVGLFGSANF